MTAKPLTDHFSHPAVRLNAPQLLQTPSYVYVVNNYGALYTIPSLVLALPTSTSDLKAHLDRDILSMEILRRRVWQAW